MVLLLLDSIAIDITLCQMETILKLSTWHPMGRLAMRTGPAPVLGQLQRESYSTFDFPMA
jgi:hypothetical protein